MAEKNILIDVTYTDLMENSRDEKENLYGKILSENKFEYIESDNIKVTVDYTNSMCKITRISEMKSMINCMVNEQTKAEIVTTNGDFIFDVKTDYISVVKNVVAIQYALYQNKQLINKINVRWIIKESVA